MASEPFSIRPCINGDCEALVELIRELASYEKLADRAKATPEQLRRHLFGEQPCAEAILAEASGSAVGFALFFQNFSTFRGQPGIYLEDIFVMPNYRAMGIGKALLRYVARLAVERDCGRLEWSVLDWNKPAIGFYQKLGAVPMSDWTIYRLHDAPLRELARGATPGENA
jgi:GNAT superfamily N-acetyltransferase